MKNKIIIYYKLNFTIYIKYSFIFKVIKMDLDSILQWQNNKHVSLCDIKEHEKEIFKKIFSDFDNDDNIDFMKPSIEEANVLIDLYKKENSDKDEIKPIKINLFDENGKQNLNPVIIPRPTFENIIINCSKPCAKKNEVDIFIKCLLSKEFFEKLINLKKKRNNKYI